MSADHDPNSTTSGTPALRTLLITDFVSSTELIETLGDKRAARIFARHDRKARDILAAHQGVEIDKTDGFLFLFTRPIDAVRFSLGYHDMLRELSAETEVHLEARAGIHVGEVILRRNSAEDIQRGAKPVEVDGLSKHAAARVMSVALGGQTLMTGPTFEIAKRGSVGESDLPEDIRWKGHGRFRLKGIAEPVPLFEIGREGLSPLRAPPDSEKVHRLPREHTDGRIRKRWLLANLVVIFLAILFFVLYNMNQRPSQKTASSPLSTKTPPMAENMELKASRSDPVPDPSLAPQTLPTILLSVETRPPGAWVHIGEEQDQAPFTISIPAEVGLVEIMATLSGYQDRKTSCQILPEHIEQGSSICTIDLVTEPRNQPRTERSSKPASEETSAPAELQAPTGYEENPFGP